MRNAPRSPRHGHLIARLAFLAVFALLIAACGGDQQAGEDPGDDPGDAPVEQEPDAPADAAEDHSFTTGGAGSGSGAFVAHGTFAEWINNADDLPHVQMTNQATAGPVENIRLLASDEIQFGLASTNILANALNAEGPFEGDDGDYTGLRILFPLWPQYSVVATFDDDLQTIEDLEGQGVNVGVGGSATFEFAHALLEGAGILDTVSIDAQEWTEGVRLLQDGIIQGMFVSGPAPFPTITEAAATPGRTLRLLDTSGAVEGALEIVPEYVPIEVPANAYLEGVPEQPIRTVGAVGYMVGHADTPDDVIYEVLDSVLSDRGKQYLKDGFAGYNFDIHPGFDPLLTLADAGTVLPLHPGAVRYWEDQGHDVPDTLRP